MYRIQAIILYRQKIRDHQVRTVLFSEEYGKITAWEKGINGNSDTGSKVEVLIERKGGQNTIKKIDVIRVPITDGWTYAEMVEYLELLKILYEALPEGTEYKTIYRSMDECISMINTVVGKVGFIVLIQSRILKILGYLDPSHFQDTKILQELYLIIHTCSMKSMLCEKYTSEPLLLNIKNSILEARHTYSYRN